MFSLEEVSKIIREDLTLLNRLFNNKDINKIITNHRASFNGKEQIFLNQDAVEDLRELLLEARRSPAEWSDFIEYFTLSDISNTGSKGAAEAEIFK